MKLNWRFWQSNKARREERAVEESRMSPHERDLDREDIVARRSDQAVNQFYDDVEKLEP
jgi:hypothetical protein